VIGTVVRLQRQRSGEHLVDRTVGERLLLETAGPWEELDHGTRGFDVTARGVIWRVMDREHVVVVGSAA